MNSYTTEKWGGNYCRCACKLCQTMIVEEKSVRKGRKYSRGNNQRPGSSEKRAIRESKGGDVI